MNLYFIASYIQHSGDYLGENPQYVYFNGSLVNFTGATLLLTLIFGVLGILICIPISSILHKMLINKVIKQYPNDKTIYIFHPLNTPINIITFFCGGFIGSYIVPLFLFDEIIHVDMVTKQNSAIYILIAVAVLIGCILFKSYTLILTNKRIIGTSYGGLVRDTSCTFENIKTINKAFGGWEIITKDNLMLPLKGPVGAKKFYERLKQLLKTENE